MSLIKGKVRLFCVSNIVVSFACTGFLGPRYFEEFQGLGQNDNNQVAATDDVIPLSQLGEGESIIESIVQTPSVEEMLKLAKKNAAQNNNTNTNTTSKKVTKTTTKKTVTTSVVKKKEVKASSNYAPAVYSEVTGSAVVNYAKRYMGLKYVHAGRSLATGTDCSGFTSLIYKEFGVTLPKTVSGQVNKGTYVKKSDLQKGDLVFYSSGTSYATHVTIYIGDGKVIHESTPRDGVKISSVNMMKYITARRVINNTAKKIAEQKLNEENKATEQKVTEEKKIETNVINTDTSNNTSTDLNNVSVNSNVNNSVNNGAIQENINDVKETNSANESLNVDESTKITSEEKKESEVIMDSKKEDSSKVEVTEVKEEPTEVKVEVQKEQVTQEQISENNGN